MIVWLISIFRQEAAPPPPPPIVINKYSDEQLRSIIKRMRERLQLYEEKVADKYASSPEISPPVSEYLQTQNYSSVGTLEHHSW